MLNKYTLILISNLVIAGSFADGLYDSYTQSAAPSTDASQSPLDRNYTVSKNMYSINQVVSTLNNLGINSRVINQQENSPTDIYIKSNTTIRVFINNAANQFGYSWSYQDSSVVFTALNPIKPKPIVFVTPPPAPPVKPIVIPAPVPAPVPVAKPVVASLLAAESKPIKAPVPQVTINNNWVVSVKDKTIRNTMMRWAKQANYQLEWQVKADFPITSNWPITGSFEDAVNQVLKASRNTDTPIKAQWYSQNNVIVIVPLTNKNN